VDGDAAVFVAGFVDGFNDVAGAVGRFEPAPAEEGEVGLVGDAVAAGDGVPRGLVEGAAEPVAEGGHRGESEANICADYGE
jgi:hypothetical protein